jgi:hypothetical protein
LSAGVTGPVDDVVITDQDAVEIEIGH